MSRVLQIGDGGGLVAKPLKLMVLKKTSDNNPHIYCPCWITGTFVPRPCPHHDGGDEFPQGAYAQARVDAYDRTDIYYIDWREVTKIKES